MRYRVSVSIGIFGAKDKEKAMMGSLKRRTWDIGWMPMPDHTPNQLIYGLQNVLLIFFYIQRPLVSFGGT